MPLSDQYVGTKRGSVIAQLNPMNSHMRQDGLILMHINLEGKSFQRQECAANRFADPNVLSLNLPMVPKRANVAIYHSGRCRRSLPARQGSGYAGSPC